MNTQAPETPASGPRRRWIFFLTPIALGAVILALAFVLKQKPTQSPLQETAAKVRVIQAPAVNAVPRVLGYGSVAPGATWEAITEVSGRIEWIHPDLKKGAILPKGAELIHIDPTDYKLAIAQAEANIRSAEAQLAELGVEETNTTASLEIESRTLALAEKDLSRKKKLLKQKAVSQASVDQEERNVLASRLSVQNLRNALNLIPSAREKLTAQLAVYTAQWEGAKLDLARTVLTAPFAARVADVKAERTQYTNSGQVLAQLDGIASAEISAQVPIDKLMSVVAPAQRSGIVPETVMASLPRMLAITPTVRLNSGELTVEWPARLARISDTLDPQTRTVGVIVAVDDPYGQVRPGARPPLAKNMFVEVELRGTPRANVVVVPRAALRNGSVFVVTSDDRLQSRDVSVLFRQTNFVALSAGLSEGEKVVISDVVPAIEGMLLIPQPDEKALQALIDEAEGRSPVR